MPNERIQTDQLTATPVTKFIDLFGGPCYCPFVEMTGFAQE